VLLYLLCEVTTYKIVVEKPEGKGPLRRPWRRWEDNIRVNVGKEGEKVWNEFMLLRIRTSGGVL